jgi:hypothetical protein
VKAEETGRRIQKEALMRIPDFGDRDGLTAAPARAQTHDPAYPVCLHVYGRGANYYECPYTSLSQFNGSASGRAGGMSFC